jgi:hypothetical protein
MTNHVWVVTFHYGRGHSETETFSNKADALRSIDVAVFKNEDCINCSIYRKDEQKVKTKLELMNDYLAIVDKM